MNTRAAISVVLGMVLWSGGQAAAQVSAAFPRDTSFNIPATFIKERKQRPYITIAAPAPGPGLSTDKDLIYKKAGGHALTLDVFYPGRIKKAKPAVLLIYGGGWRSGDKTHNYAIATALANSGYVAVTATYRLSPEAVYPAAVLDLKAAVAWMRHHARQYGIDAGKIAVLGCSAGGQLAALLGTTNDDPEFAGGLDTAACSVQAVIDIDGTLAFHHPESAEGAVAAQWLGGSYAEKPEVWEDAAPLSHVTAAAAPILFLNSALPRFHAGRDDMVRRLQALGIYTEQHTLEDTPHPFWFFHPWFEPMMDHIIHFLNRQFR